MGNRRNSVLRSTLWWAVAVVVFARTADLRAATYSWQVQSGDWSVASNWGGTAPTTGQTAYIANGGTATVAESGGSCNVLSLGSTAGAGTVQMTDGSFVVAGGGYTNGHEYLGYSGTGSFTQSGGTHTLANVYDGNLYLGYNAGSVGTYNLGSGGLLTTTNISLNTNVDDLWVGFSGSGTFNQSGGTVSMVSVLNLGTNGNSSGSYVLQNGSLQVAKYETLGYSGSGTFSQSGGTNSTAELDVASSLGSIYPNGTGVYTLAAGQFSASTELVGIAGPGAFNQSGGTNTVSASLTLGSLSGASGTYSLAGGRLILSSLKKGSGTAAFNFGGGTLQANGTLATSLPMTLTGNGGGATIDTAGCPVTLSGSLSGPGSLTKIDSGTLTLATTNTYGGNTLIGGGTLALSSPIALQNSTLDSSGSGALSFGTLSSATLGGLAGPGTLNLANSSANAIALSLGNNNASTTFSGQLIGGGSLIKVGSGTLDLLGAETYSGTTAISQGTLFINGSMVSPIAVQNGGLLGGAGSLANATVNSGGTLAPGDPLGTMQLSGSLSLLSGAKMDFDLDTPADSSKVLMSAGTLVLSGQQFADFDFAYTASFGQGTYDLIDAGTIVGSLGSGTNGMINGLPASLAVQGNDLVLNVVPEPGTLWLLAVGLIGAAGWFQWRRHRTTTGLV